MTPFIIYHALSVDANGNANTNVYIMRQCAPMYPLLALIYIFLPPSNAYNGMHTIECT